jgi:Zn-finger nucleic acid-binding protein
MLDPTLEGISTCLRCEGIWIAPATLDAAFGSPRWPAGQTLWWRTPIECPDCAFDGVSTLMTTRMSSDVIVDQCAQHGVWLDRGELGRLMGAGSDELEALRARLAVIAPDLEQLVARREKWRTDVEIRRKAALERQQAAELERRRNKVTESERVRLREEARGRAATADTQVLPTTPMPGRALPVAPSEPAQPVAKRRQRLGTQLTPVAMSTEAAQQAASRRQQIDAERAQLSADVALLEGRVTALDDHVSRLEAQLDDARHHADSVRGELDAARERLRMLDEQLEAPA